MTVSFLTTYRNSDQYRLTNLEKVIAHVAAQFPDWEIVLVEQDEEATLASHEIQKNTNYLHVYNPGPFNKSWGMNVAYQLSTGSMQVFSDADMIMQAADLQRAVDACAKELDAVRPYERLIDMTAEQTEKYYREGELPDLPDKERGFDRMHNSERLCMAGGLFITRREYFERVGGFDERFSGWGGEDDAMSIKLMGLSSKVAIAREAVAWHLWHPRDGRYAHAEYEINKRLLHEYMLLNHSNLVNLAQEQLKSIGQPEKYLEARRPADD